jgi:hypothetical protein
VIRIGRNRRSGCVGIRTIQCGPQTLTSYGGLELLRRYLARIDLMARLRTVFAELPSNYGTRD